MDHAAAAGEEVHVFFISTPPLKAEEAGTPVALTGTWWFWVEVT